MLKSLAPLPALLLMAGTAVAQSPFQSAPGPAPPPTPRPRPAMHPRPIPRPQQEEPPPTVTAMPAPAVAPQPPPPPSLAGAWHYWSNCPLDTVADWTLTPIGPDQYRVTGPSGLLSIPVGGWVSGKMVHVEADPPLNHLVWEATVESPTIISGKMHAALGNITCDWSARKK